MDRASVPHLLGLLCGAVLVVLMATGCGGDRSKLIPSQRAQDLVGQLDAIKANIDAGECDGLKAKLATFHHDATSLPSTVDSRLRTRINDGVQALQDHAVDNCEAVAQAGDDTTTTTPTDTTPTDTTTTETTPTTTSTTTTSTTPTESTPSDTTPSDTTPTDTTPPDTGDDGTSDTDTTGDDGSTPPTDNGGTSGEGSTP